MPPASTAPPPSRTVLAVGLGLLVVLIFAIYWPALSNDLVWDDRPNLIENDNVRGFSGEHLRWAFTETHVGHYQPLTWVSFMIDDALWGGTPRGFHLTNIFLHAINAVLFAAIGLRLCRLILPRGALAASLIAAAMFAVHPMRVESVAWATERRDVLSGAFFLGSLLLYLIARDRGSNGRLHPGFLAASLVVFALSLLSKALGMALPVVLLVLDVYPLRRLEGEHWRRAAPRVLLEKLPYFALAVASAVIAIVAQSERALAPLEIHGWLERSAQAFYGACFYVRTTFLASQWYPLHEMRLPLDAFAPRFVGSAVFTLGLTAVLIWKRRQWPGALAIWLIYLALVAPMLGLAQSGQQLVADRYSYLSCLGLALLVGWLAVTLWHSLKPDDWRRWLCAGAVMGGLVIWSVQARRQVSVWRSEETLWTHVLKGGPSSRAYNNLGVIADTQGETEAAAMLFASALEVAPTYGRARSNLIGILERSYTSFDRESLTRAANALRGSLAVLAPDDPFALRVLGLSMLRLGDNPQAVTDFEQLVRLRADAAQGWELLGRARLQTGDTAGAIEALERAVQLDPASQNAAGLLRNARGG
jgi:hypothetical protein